MKNPGIDVNTFAKIIIIIVLNIIFTQKIYGNAYIQIKSLVNDNIFITKNDQKIRTIGIKIKNKAFYKNKKSNCNYKKINNFLRSKILNKKLKIKQNKVGFQEILLPTKESLAEVFLWLGFAEIDKKTIQLLPQSKQKKYKKLEKKAQQNKKGIWKECEDDSEKIRRFFGKSAKKWKKKYLLNQNKASTGIVKKVLTANRIVLDNGAKIELKNIEIPKNKALLANRCFSEEAKKFAEKSLLNRRIFLSKPDKHTDTPNKYMKRYGFILSKENSLNPLSSVAQIMKENGYAQVNREKNPRIFSQITKKPIGAWKTCLSDILKIQQEDIHNPNNCSIKGNITGSKKNPQKKYHTQQSPWYKRTVAEKCFKTEQEALNAGFTKVR